MVKMSKFRWPTLSHSFCSLHRQCTVLIIGLFAGVYNLFCCPPVSQKINQGKDIKEPKEYLD